MNARQLEKLGVTAECVKPAIMAIASASKAEALGDRDAKDWIKLVVGDPASHVDDAHFGALAQALLTADAPAPIREPISYRTWGEALIDPQSHIQMRQACALPMAVGAALMPDAHVGYGLPIGGVLALEGAVVPYAVGVDIACRMKLSVLDVAPEAMSDDKRGE